MSQEDAEGTFDSVQATFDIREVFRRYNRERTFQNLAYLYNPNPLLVHKKALKKMFRKSNHYECERGEG